MDKEIRLLEERILRYVIVREVSRGYDAAHKERALLSAGFGTYSLRDDALLLERLYTARDTEGNT